MASVSIQNMQNALCGKVCKKKLFIVKRDMHMQKERERFMEMISVKFRRTYSSTEKGQDCS